VAKVRLGVDVVDGRRRVEARRSRDARRILTAIDHVGQVRGWLWSVTW
jgi:hypothetical protein